MSHLSLALLSFQVLQLEKVFVNEANEGLQSKQLLTERSYNGQLKRYSPLNTESVLRLIHYVKKQLQEFKSKA